MIALKLLLLVVVVGCIAYAAISIFPRKLALARRLGPKTTNDDLIAAAKSGDPEAADLYRKSRRIFWIAIASAVSLSLLHSLTKEHKGK
jgi:predicted NBD/HSP70 family sugar kinase